MRLFMCWALLSRPINWGKESSERGSRRSYPWGKTSIYSRPHQYVSPLCRFRATIFHLIFVCRGDGQFLLTLGNCSLGVLKCCGILWGVFPKDYRWLKPLDDDFLRTSPKTKQEIISLCLKPSNEPKAETSPHYSPSLQKKSPRDNGSGAEKSCGSHKSPESGWMLQVMVVQGFLWFLWADDIYRGISHTSWPSFLLHLLQLMPYSHTICMHSLKIFRTINLKTFELCNPTWSTPGMSRCIQSCLIGVTNGHCRTLSL